MSDRKSFRLSHSTARASALKAVQEAPDGYSVTIQEPNRSRDQNSHFHAIIGDIVKSGIKWGGKTRDADDWKALLVSAHAVATKQGGEIIPGLEGEFVAIREGTARMSKSRASSLIEYTLAWCAANGVQINDTRYQGF